MCTSTLCNTSDVIAVMDNLRTVAYGIKIFGQTLPIFTDNTDAHASTTVPDLKCDGLAMISKVIN